MATGTLFPAPYFTALDSDGVTLSGALGYFYAAGTTTPLDTFSEVTLTTANTNPVVADAAGRFVAYLTPGLSYKFLLKTAAGTTVRTVDNIGAVPPSTVDLDVTGTAGVAIAAGEVAYLSDGSGGLTAGRWYLADADLVYGSITCVIGLAPAAIAGAASGSLRMGGRLTGLTGLTAGTNYYVSATAGALTATAPTNARLVGTADGTTSLIVTANPDAAAVIQRTVRVNATSPYNLLFPSADGAGAITSDGAGTLSFVQASYPANCRLTLETAVPVSTSDQLTKTSLFITPYAGDRIALYSGTVWVNRSFTEITVPLAGLTASKPYDVFVYDNAGVVAAETLVWTNTTTRATALTTQNGVLVKTGALTRRYVGTFYVNGSGGQTDDGEAKRNVWNYYNRVDRNLRKFDATSSWTYTTDTWREANGTTNRVEAVVGWAEDAIAVVATGYHSNSNGTVYMRTGIGEDLTNAAVATATAGLFRITDTTTPNDVVQTTASLHKVILGFHFYAWLEKSTAGSGTTTFYGANSDGQAGIFGLVRG